MTQNERAEPRELLAKATPGEWNYWHRDMSFGEHAVVGFSNFDALIYGDRQHNVGPTKRRTDAALIVAAHNALPSLLDELDGKDLEIARLTARCAEMERAMIMGRTLCDVCVHTTRTTDESPCKGCWHGNRTQHWQFDESRFATKEEK